MPAIARPAPLRLAWFISPHGFGHAARASALMGEIARTFPQAEFEIFTTVPEWFFADSLPGCVIRHHPLLADVGLVQKSAIEEDLAATVTRLERLLPYDPAALTVLGKLIRTLGCRLVFADISPLGLAVAEVAGIPSVLVENFTWDWIYRGYLDEQPALAPIADELERIFQRASVRIRTEPYCGDAVASLQVAPVSRVPRLSRRETRSQLGLSEDDRVVLVTMGGIPWAHKTLAQGGIAKNVVIIIPGGSEVLERQGAFLILPFHSNFYHPDLVAASDAVIGKLGYSTLAEAYHAGVPFGFIPRPRFPESPPLESFIGEKMSGCPIHPEQLVDGGWLDRLDEVLTLPTPVSPRRSGNTQIVEFLRREKLLP